uniref:Uncharacterized protein n=1 Tax=Glycine max TaxID=3847 RepID=C6SYV4_SOYBN|nr:unknown [Glycine max]
MIFMQDKSAFTKTQTPTMPQTQPKNTWSQSTLNYSARKLSVLSNLAVPVLDDSPIASGDAAFYSDSLFKEEGIPEISFIK